MGATQGSAAAHQPIVVTDQVPSELADACAGPQRESAEALFKVASKYYEPVAVGMLQDGIARGGPLVGIVADTQCGHTMVINGFQVCYYNEEGRLVTEFKSIDDLLGTTFACFSSALQEVMQMGASRPWVAYGWPRAFPPMVWL